MVRTFQQLRSWASSSGAYKGTMPCGHGTLSDRREQLQRLPRLVWVRLAWRVVQRPEEQHGPGEHGVEVLGRQVKGKR